MNITKAHLDFWRQKTTRVPSWGTAVATKEQLVEVDDLVNGPWNRRDARHDAHNLLCILRSARERGAMRSVLAKIAEAPGTIVNPKRRQAFAKKWLARIERDSPECTCWGHACGEVRS